MIEAELWHNPVCSKSRGALELLRQRGIEPRLFDYLENPPDVAALRELLRKLRIPARELLRRNETEFERLSLEVPALDDDALIAAMADYPILIERPILVLGERAVIARPPERVLELLGQ